MAQPNHKKHMIYKRDKWNMLTIEVQGSKLIAREISDQWGEETHEFRSRPALLNWAEQRFRKETFEGDEQERLQILEAIRQV
ncbi:hypothetical protein ACFQWB_15560 [Paenibacillus thermoaerophilus]|uniref:Uncharacterized protein n=1 Tax=Paenibacillus thermoaerophilus TaxID=1215385 RepID=A0ABW2V5E7_9BACL|nr:hypothetical protein [Paenibacillus thermoaerophilus]TMV17860.1 hypothetical protein FE781_05240 [Paenibacillus thermoaerophilus]